MSETKRTIVVTGATGHQGGAVARCLLKSGHWNVRAITRDPKKPESRLLKDLGCEIVQCDQHNRSAVESAFQGAYGVFSVQAWWEDGLEGEVAMGKTLADCAKSLGIQHFVYSSVACSDCNTGIPHFETKREIERHIASLELPATILRPVFFMENFLADDIRRGLFEGSFSLPLRSDLKLPMISVEDIGCFVSLAFEHPEEWIGRTLTIGGDELTMPQVAEAFSRVLERPVTYVESSIESVRRYSAEVATMFQWFNRYGLYADIRSCRQLHPDLKTFETWLHATDWAKLRAAEADQQVYIPVI